MSEQTDYIFGNAVLQRREKDVLIALRNYVCQVAHDTGITVNTPDYIGLMSNNSFQTCLDLLDPEFPPNYKANNLKDALQAFEHALDLIARYAKCK